MELSFARKTTSDDLDKEIVKCMFKGKSIDGGVSLNLRVEGKSEEVENWLEQQKIGSIGEIIVLGVTATQRKINDDYHNEKDPNDATLELEDSE